MTDKEKIRNIIELFITWNGETDVIDVANIDSAVEFIVDSLQEEPVSNDFEEEYDNYTKHILACDVQFKPFTHLYNCAKHFFELGLKAKGK